MELGASWRKIRLCTFELMRSNKALEQSVNGWQVGAAGACEQFAPAAPGIGVPRPAQRER